ncbi:MAG: hypothetical protein HQL87_13780 [Magnetococcales bacterium]|nr:hypothetical protein [Magnetococcales bacterium]
MSTAIAFDTYDYVRKLRSVGVDEAQAAIQAEALVSLVEDRLATKQDMAELKRDMATIEANLKRDIETTKADLKRDMKEMELRMVVKMGAMILASVGMIIGFLRAFPIPVQFVQPPAQEMRQLAPSPGRPPAPPSAPAH